MKTILSLLFSFTLVFWAQAQKNSDFFNFEYNEKDGSILLDVPADKGEFLYVNYLSSGLGSNDIGLDRGQIGDSRVVEFKKYGNTLFLIQKNLEYRAVSQNKEEKQSVEEAFASSVLYAFPILKTTGNIYTININSLLLSDSHKVSQRLKNSKEGQYKLDKSRSAVLPEHCKSFPENTEFRAMQTFGGNPTGKYVSTVVPTPESITLRTHHSFVQLPDDAYKVRAFHPASGYFMRSYKDYAAPIEADMTQRMITRHRLEKNKDGSVKEPIVYYIDRGCPEPIKSALMEGASWWNQAFEAAGFKNAFQVKELPEGADPLDVRYNMIQWVHRSTRGWSYGASVVDPRTGEIIKGHVSLGSLRVRQDFMIMEALMSPYDWDYDYTSKSPMTEIALARLRQLSAHEVGHTIGLAHNFAASVNNRASVMDYPHPTLKWTGTEIDFSQVYDDKIGAWDKQAIKYGYTIFEGDEDAGLQGIIKENEEMGLFYITDSDARPQGGAHVHGHLWDNGENAVYELENLIKIREHGLKNFGEHSIKKGTPYSELEKRIVPLYMLTRYQVEAVAKYIGGYDYSYDVKDGDVVKRIKRVNKTYQQKATDALLVTLSDDFLNQGDFIELILPRSPGYNRTRESVKGKMGPIYDPYALASASSKHTLQLMLHPERLNRLALLQNQKDEKILDDYFDKIEKKIMSSKDHKLLMLELYVDYLFSVFNSETSLPLVKSECYRRVSILYDNLFVSEYIKNRIRLFKNCNNIKNYSFEKVHIPPGSPIGCHE